MLNFLKRKKAGGRTLETRDKAVLVGGLGVFAVLSAALINRSSIWFDEAFGAYLIRFGYGDIARYTASDVHPPLYYWVLKTWSIFFGTGEVALRSLSVVFAGIALTFAFLFLFKYLGRRAAWAGLAFGVLTPFFVRYGVEARMYTMVTALAFGATYMMTLADRSKKTWHWAVYGVLVGLGMLTHYFSLLVWLTHWVWRLYVRRSEGLRGRALARAFFSRGWIVAHVIAFALFAPWIGALVNQLRDVQVNGFWIQPFTPATPINFLTNVALYREQADVRSWAALVFCVFAVAITVTAVIVARRVLGVEQKKYFFLIVLLGVLPPVLLLLLSLPPLRPSFVDRYVVPSALSLGLLTGVAIGLSRLTTRRRAWVLLPIFTAGVFAYGIVNVFVIGNYNNTLHQSNDTRQVIAGIRDRSPAEPIIANSPWLYYEAAFYSTPTSPVYFIDADTEYQYGSLLMLQENDLGKIKNLKDFEAAHPSFWYVGRQGDGDLTPPGANLRVTDSFRFNDDLSGQPSYQAVRYTVL